MKGVLLFVASACFAIGLGAPQLSSNGAKTVDQLAATLIRLGEPDAAKELLKHSKDGRVRFATFTGRSGSTTAEVGGALGNWGPADTNVLTFNQVYENYGPRTDPARPWNPKMDWVGLASTVIHEQRHMVQYMPSRKPEHEDPAWRDQEAALQRWKGRLADEVDQALALPDGALRLSKMTEIGDLLRGLRESAHTLNLARQEYEKQGWLTPRKAWTLAQTSAEAERLLRRIMASEPAALSGLTLPPLVVPATGAWILSRTVVWSDNTGIQDGTLIAEYANGPAKVQGMVIPELSKHRWERPTAERPITSLAVMWSRPPDMLRPGTDAKILAKAADMGSTKDPGIAGDFVGFDPAIWVSDDGKAFRFVWQGRPALYANPGRFEEREFRLPIPSSKSAILHLNIATGNIFWGKTVTYEYKWKEGVKLPAKPPVKSTPSKKPVPPKKKGG